MLSITESQKNALRPFYEKLTKYVSKIISMRKSFNWLPDISRIESFSAALDVSAMELMKGKYYFTMLYVCPICDNVIHTLGNITVGCRGVFLPVLEVELLDKHHLGLCAL